VEISPDNQSSIVKRIIDGSVTIDSVGEFENIIRIFPDDPGVYRAFADLLVEKKSFEAAANAYRKATRLFLDLGMVLQATVAKILEWRIVQPSHQEGRAFHAALRTTAFHGSVLHSFLARMSYPELVAFMVKLVRVRLSSGKWVKRFGEAETDIYLVVSGALQESVYEVLEGGKKGPNKSTTDLVENEYFGDIYPFEGKKVSQSDVETITRAELVKISRERLREVCQKYPNVESLVKELYGAGRGSGDRKASRTVRKATRHQLPTKVRMKIFPEDADKSPVVADGFTEDISSGGACLLLEARYRSGPSSELVGRKVKVEIDLPKAELKVNVLGTLVWSKEVPNGEEKTTAVGIQFTEMSDGDRTALDDYCFGSDGEQNLIWSLWESYVKP